MADYICIDGGTTNTRLRLVQSRRVTYTLRLEIGVRMGGEDPAGYRECLKNAIETLLRENAVQSGQIHRILASGMITSELGLYALPHLPAPAGIQELHDSAVEVLLPELSSIPFVFLRGVRKNGTCMEESDVMRGEETELMGILQPHSGNAYVLPGSHTKVIYTDEQGRITDFFTTLTGEMIDSLSSHTILKNSVDLKNGQLLEDRLLAGYAFCRKEGLNKALFKVRIADTLFSQSPAARYSFFLGAVLCGDITAILNAASRRVVIAGREQIKEALYTILKQETDLELFRLTPEETENSVALGAVRIYEYGQIN